MVKRPILVNTKKINPVNWSKSKPKDKMFSAAGLVLILALSTANGAEQCLKNPPKAVKIDSKWISTIPDWHLTSGSHLHIYRTAAEIANVPENEVRPEVLYYEACLRFHWTKSTIITGFGHNRADCKLTPKDDGSFTFHYPYLHLDGHATPVATDNKSFIMFYVCWPASNEASFAVISPVTHLRSNAQGQIKQELKKLGLDAKDMVTLRFESCIARERARAAGVDFDSEEDDEDDSHEEL